MQLGANLTCEYFFVLGICMGCFYNDNDEKRLYVCLNPFCVMSRPRARIVPKVSQTLLGFKSK